jgi:hypothetical protein
MPRTLASSVFNLNPAGTPISHTQPDLRILSVKAWEIEKIQFKIGLVFARSKIESRVPKVTSMEMLHKKKCFCKEQRWLNSIFGNKLYKKGKKILENDSINQRTIICPGNFVYILLFEFVNI